jgi:hypothetical protein
MPSTVPSPAWAQITEPGAQAVDRLMVEGVHGHHPGADDGGEARAGEDLDVVRRLGARLDLPVAGKVLVQRAAAGDVERLGAPADAQQRRAALVGGPGERQLELVERWLRRAQLDVPIGAP